MRQFTVSTKLNICVLGFVIPLVSLLYFYSSSIDERVDFAKNEVVGAHYLRPVVELLNTTQQHRELSIRTTLGDSGAAGGLQSLAAKGDELLKTLALMQDEYGKTLKLSDSEMTQRGKGGATFAKIRSGWASLIAGNANDAQYQAFITSIRDLITHVGDTSNLILDPNLDSYYMMDVVTVSLPQTLDRLGSVYQFGATHHTTGLDTLRKTGAFVTMLEEADAARTRTGVETALIEDANYYGTVANLKSDVEPKLGTYLGANNQLTKLLEALEQDSQTDSIPALLAQTTQTRETAMALWEAANHTLEAMLEARVSTISNERNTILGLFSLGLVLAYAFFFLITRSIKKPLLAIKSAMVDMASGTLETAVPYTEKGDEIGDMARALSNFKDSALEARRLSNSQRDEELRKAERQEQVERLIKEFDTHVGGLLANMSKALSGMGQEVENMAAISERASTQTQSTIAATGESAQNVATVAAAAEELSAAINEISRQISRSSTITNDAVNKTKIADTTVTQLSDAAQKIGDVINLIGNITAQIDLLALNATIESARAGEAGKGFAVVASEVKNLASQTGKATEAIEQQITGVQKEVGEVVKSLTDIRSIIDEINNVSTTIASAVEEQGAATREIASNIQKTSDRVKEVAASVDDVGHMAEDTSASAGAVLTAVRQFSDQSDQLQQTVQSFLGNIARV